MYTSFRKLFCAKVFASNTCFVFILSTSILGKHAWGVHGPRSVLLSVFSSRSRENAVAATMGGATHQHGDSGFVQIPMKYITMNSSDFADAGVGSKSVVYKFQRDRTNAWVYISAESEQSIDPRRGEVPCTLLPVRYLGVTTDGDNTFPPQFLFC